jgi:hypothetical protein
MAYFFFMARCKGMGTRSETVIWDGHAMIVLFKHWDGYPEEMMPYFMEIFQFAKEMAKDQIHWLTYSEDVAAYIIGYDCIRVREEVSKGMLSCANVDFRPIGKIADCVEYVYIIDVTRASWKIDCYEVVDYKRFWRLSRRGRDRLYMAMIKGEKTEMLRLIAHEELKLVEEEIPEEIHEVMG